MPKSIHIYTCIHAHNSAAQSAALPIIYVQIDMHIYTHFNICIYTYIHIYIYAYIHTNV